MENIKHFFEVDLKPSSIRTLSRKDNGKLLHPYKDVVISIHEVYVCPFCGKTMEGFECKCKKFNQAFKRLQKLYGDNEDRKSCFHGPELNIQCGISKSISEFNVRILKNKEIDKLGRDVWDYATRHTDYLSDKSYLVAPAKQEGDNLYIICKDLTSKKVYRFETPLPAYKDKLVFLGVYVAKTVSNVQGISRKIGNYHFEYFWRHLADFDDWNAVCEALKKV
jgi:hypothetical protein